MFEDLEDLSSLDEILHDTNPSDLEDLLADRGIEKGIEAPNDIEQAEQISDVLADCPEIRFENWQNLELCEKEVVLNQLEAKIAEIECRPPCPIRLEPLEKGSWGGYNPETQDIRINSDYADLTDFDTYREVLDTLVHEGRHAYQDYNLHYAEVHPRHSEVESWRDTWGNGKWEYMNDCSTKLGVRLYEQQSIEIDARNFAADVLQKFDLKV